MYDRKNRIINIRPFQLSAKLHSDVSFTLTFIGCRGENTNFNTPRTEVRLTFDFWWIKHIKNQIKKLVADAQERVNEASRND